MFRRIVVSILWFLSISMASEVVWSVAATPRVLGPILGIAAAAFMFADPLRVFHPAPGADRVATRPAPLAPEGSLAAR